MVQTAQMTELEAVNLMLSVIGESPVNSLIGTGMSDVTTAQGILQEVSREVQADGWFFNNEDNVILPIAADGFIYTPPDILRMEPMKFESAQTTIRGNRVYDRFNHTYTFTKPISFSITYFLQYTELPQDARFYIAVRAARKFQKRNLSSDLIEKFNEQDELDALANMQDQDTSAGEYNLLTGNVSMTNICVR